jgi:hypothetical protein
MRSYPSNTTTAQQRAVTRGATLRVAAGIPATLRKFYQRGSTILL